MDEPEKRNEESLVNPDKPRELTKISEESYYEKATPILWTMALGSGRIISNIALVNQGMQKTFFYVGLKAFPYPETLSGIAAFANGTSDSLTRFPAIYKNMTERHEDELNLMCAKERPQVNNIESGIYLYRDNISENVYALIIHEDKEDENLILTDLDNINQYNIANLGWPIKTSANTYMSIKNEKLKKFIISHCKQTLPEYYSLGLTSIYCSIMAAGILDMTYFTLNNFSAIIQLECQYLGDKHCNNGFDWPHILPYLPAAVICSLSTGYAFAAYTLPSIKRNAMNFIDYLDKFSENFSKENKLLLFGTSILAVMFSISLGATLFFSTSKMLFNLLGPTLSEYNIFQSQVYISMMTSIIGGLFSWIAEGKKLLQGQKAGFREWFLENSHILRGVFAATLLPTLTINVASHALNNFPGNIEILDKIFSGDEKVKMGFAIANAVNTAFLYFAFNTGQAISNAAGVENDATAKLCALYSMSYLPNDLENYKNNYILFNKERLYYINFEKKINPVKINNFNKFLNDVDKINGEGTETIYLSSKQFKELITFNGGYKHPKRLAKLLAFHGMFNACSQSNKIEEKNIIINIDNEAKPLIKPENKNRCGCTLF